MTSEDAIKWLENLKQDIGQLRHENLWPYAQAIDEVIALLEEQEPQKVINRYTKWNSVLMGNCPKCNAVLHEFDNAKACGVCGQAVKWND